LKHKTTKYDTLQEALNDPIADRYYVNGSKIMLCKHIEEKEYDAAFVDKFVDNWRTYEHVDELMVDINTFEEDVGRPLNTHYSDPTVGYKAFSCKVHQKCCFKASFTMRHNVICLYSCIPYHCGEERPIKTAAGRSHKIRRGRWLNKSIDLVATAKHEDPVPMDIVKTAASSQKKAISYNHAFRALTSAKEDKYVRDHQSYQRLPNYLIQFAKYNPGSVIECTTDDLNRVHQVFVCPGIMNSSLQYVRPMISLDACHLKGKDGGILYMATTKSANNNIYIVAFSIINGNEDLDGWVFFLEHLKKACPILVTPHPLARIKYCRFTFISDRDKGLIPALAIVFPNNHSIHCSVHIQRNVKDRFGKKVARYIDRLAKTYSHAEAEELLQAIGNEKPEARFYVEGIESSVWRATAWIDDRTLPPRYGITSSNASEAANAMINVARRQTWLYAVHLILEDMCHKICLHREEIRQVQDLNSVVEPQRKYIANRYTASAGYQIYVLDLERQQYKINRTSEHFGTLGGSYRLDLINGTCSCGMWQDLSVPCPDLVGYRQIREKKRLEEIMVDDVSPVHTARFQLGLYQYNINPVWMDTVVRDGVTQPPAMLKKKKPGRPPTKRKQKKSRFAKEKYSNRECRNCYLKGHNIRTCPKPMRDDIDEHRRIRKRYVGREQNISQITCIPITTNNTTVNTTVKGNLKDDALYETNETTTIADTETIYYDANSKEENNSAKNEQTTEMED
jgi:hypothetical protein